MSVPCNLCGVSAYVSCKHRPASLDRPEWADKADGRGRGSNPYAANGKGHIMRLHAKRRKAAHRAELDAEEMDEAQAAEYLGLKPYTLEQYRYRRCGPDHLREGDLVVYRRADLDRWNREGRGKADGS